MSSRSTINPPNLTPKGLSLKQRREARLQAALRDNLRRRKAGDGLDNQDQDNQDFTPEGSDPDPAEAATAEIAQ